MSRTLERKISMRSTKEEFIKKDVLMPDGSDKDQDSKINVFLWNLPDVEEMPSHDGETVQFSFGLHGRTAADSGQSGWPVVAAKAKQSSRAGAANEN
ncbi:hypothetical protein TNCV_4115671 [Trichonephila clavipes]|nr:hypothetical protein TNCV_4115671 [Trichonephila clavipes]